MVEISEVIRNQFPYKKILIVGDLVADQFLRGTISRVSREAPVFILRHDDTETLAGGAANAAVNVASLGGEAVLVGLVGKDTNAEHLLTFLAASSVNTRFVVQVDDFRTITKIRVLAGQQYAPRQQVIRIDYENQNPINDDVLEKLKSNLITASAGSDAIVVSDYNYGVVSDEIFEVARKIAGEKNIPLVVDSRFRLENFPGATSATPNKEEVEQLLGNGITEIACVELCKKLNYRSMLVTLGNKGMLLIQEGEKPVKIDCVGSSEPIDVTGAGDTVIAAFTLGLASGVSFAESAEIANHAGGIVVMKKGTASVCASELIGSIESNSK